ncbi:pyridoxal-phosphate dependent enzyme [Porticoccus sp. W117]|uniref:1-aminocyclopropane-1-carboxylate deaminase/D-cysteine desulfhydrase n=1 Tax=Porticoccus sp. W117 TaxID=3054777 RepID=UPI0025979A19|nr:pyridoxal-phosphate dependent enzyme [Porticoccus sp. W117]MDM3870428.1 pyridoxal-phosphate dependent enzyme [Porticoccus sp. W117]
MNTPVHRVNHPLLAAKKLSLWVKREDLSHPQISGNKYHKLKYNLAYAKEQGFETVASFGGAWSNHLHALAYAGKESGLKTLGFVRGPLPVPLNATLQDASDWGMALHSLSYSDYRRRHDRDFCQQLMASVANGYLIPEGGANPLAIKGCAELGEDIARQVEGIDYLCAACGTGATMAGLIAGVSERTTVLGFSAVKNNHKLESDIRAWLPDDINEKNWRILHNYHCGGFGKLNRELIDFLDEWQMHCDIPLEPLYTGKMFYGLFNMIADGFFPAGTKIVALHSGGLQGLRGMAHQLENFRGS